MAIDDKHLAINGGDPVSKQVIVIHKPGLQEIDARAAYDAVFSTFVSGDGPACREFESKLAEYIGVKHVLFVNSATTALDLAFRAKSYPAGAEVLVPDFTYTSTALGAIYNNLTVKLVDVEPDTGNIDPGKLEAAISPKTVAIAPVDYAGNPADMDKVREIARKHGLYIVHDTAQSIGALYKGKRTGCQGDVSTFSFHGTKNMTTGEGGALVTDDDEIAERVKILREKGTNKHSFLTDNITRGYYEYVDIGNSYVQSNILGAIGCTQLDRLEEMNAVRAEIADYYLRELTDLPLISFARQTPGATTNWHIFYIQTPPEHKYWIMDALRAEGVYANVHYTPLHRNRYYANLGTDAEFPGTMKFFSGLLRLPIYPTLTVEERALVVAATRKVITALAR